MELKRKIDTKVGGFSVALELLPDAQEVELSFLTKSQMDSFIMDDDYIDYDSVVLTLDEAADLIHGLRDAIEDCASVNAYA
jgi:hypothetical protein